MAGWATRLKIYFAAKNSDLSVHNLGISGNTTVDLLKRMKVEAIAREPQIIVFAIGINDSRFRREKNNQEVSLMNFKKNLEKLQKIALEFTPRIVWVGITPVVEPKTTSVTWKPDKSYTNNAIEEYDRAIRAHCTKTNSIFISMKGLIENQELPDGLHPDANGHKKMFEKIKKEIERMTN
jgi:lysophospholipase L1-like esterase